MFTQNPHSLYENLLTHDYKLQETGLTNWRYLICHDQKLSVRLYTGTLCVLDLNNDSNANFPWSNIFDLKNQDYTPDVSTISISTIIDKFVDVVKESLSTQNIEIMNLIIYEITQKYPDIKQITFLDGPKPTAKKSILIDQSNNFYEIKGSNIPEFKNYFAFIDNMQLSFTHFLKESSNHEMLENTEKYLEYKQKFKTDICINKI